VIPSLTWASECDRPQRRRIVSLQVLEIDPEEERKWEAARTSILWRGILQRSGQQAGSVCVFIRVRQCCWDVFGANRLRYSCACFFPCSSCVIFGSICGSVFLFHSSFRFRKKNYASAFLLLWLCIDSESLYQDIRVHQQETVWSRGVRTVPSVKFFGDICWSNLFSMNWKWNVEWRFSVKIPVIFFVWFWRCRFRLFVVEEWHSGDVLFGAESLAVDFAGKTEVCFQLL